MAILSCGGGGGGATGGNGGAQTTGSGGSTGAAGETASGGTAGEVGGRSGAGGTVGTAGNSGTAGTRGTGNAGSGGTISGGTGGGPGIAGTSGMGGKGGAGATGTGVAGAGGAGLAGAGGTSSSDGGRGVAGTGGGAGAGGVAGQAGTGGSNGGAVGRGGAGGTAGAAGMPGGGFMPCPTAAGTACAILPLGDSITEGYLPTGGLGGYRVELFSQAVLAGKNITFVGSLTSANAPSTVQNRTFPKKHEGHDGYTIDTGTGTSGISGSITDQAIANYHPSIVLLMIGTNDVNGNIDVANAPTRLGKLIDEITTDSPSALVVVASIIPIARGNNSKAMAYNAAIPGLVSTRAAAGKHVIFVDNYAAFAKDPNYQTSEMSNYLHPNTAGYAILGDSFYGAIGAYLP